ncbi:hypothetical protein [Qipengyuania marisflavi]|uniref:Uncharacterized protein n=1 Tax=Qipengyuania marisflavi TaxID=2486356 RepID=A0A5S3P233_9SPHN|nr:hypothetical protein [Qipengyuania marisflavi]TMM46709.1 hypothetical protein FEV51_10780 [Qipengyuania marisflavi]
MEDQDGKVHLNEEEASGGSKEGVVRWILLGGLLLAIVLLSVTWIVPAMMQGDVEEEATVSGEIQSREDDGGDTDSIVSDQFAPDAEPTAVPEPAETN